MIGTSGNEIHRDSEARQLGFKGALVPGAAVFGHMSYPIVEQLGSTWLSNYKATIRFIKPAYDGDRLGIRLYRDEDVLVVDCYGPGEETGVLLAQIRSGLVKDPIDPVSRAPGSEHPPQRSELNWDGIVIGQAFPSWQWHPDKSENEAYTLQVSDPHSAYLEGVMHPHAILDIANISFSRIFSISRWILVSAEISFRKLVREADVVTVHSVPVEKWQNKGRQFVSLYVACLVGDEVACEIKHTSIIGFSNSISHGASSNAD